MNSREAIPKPIERSWAGGPWIQTHKSKYDASVMYVCDICLLPAYTGVRIATTPTDERKWMCASCERGQERLPRRARSREEMAGILRGD